MVCNDTWAGTGSVGKTIAVPRSHPTGARRTALALAALSTLALAFGPAASASGTLLCGVTRVTDRILECPSPQGRSQDQQSGGTAPATSAPRPAGAQTKASPLGSTGPVARTSTTPAYRPNTLVVRFEPGTTAAREAAELRRLGVTSSRRIDALQARVVHVPAGRMRDVMAALQRSTVVAKATRDEILHVLAFTPNDTNFNLQWGLKLAGFPAAWQHTHGSRSVVVAVLDTGVDGSVPDLKGSVRPAIDLTGTGTRDTNGHGTTVAGVIAAHANNGLGGAGVCWACTILPIKVMNSDGKGDLATVAQGIVRATDLHARVIDLSLGGPTGLDALKQAVDYATSKGVIVVAAAGNSGRSVPFYPAGYPNVLSVAATNAHDKLYGWSERGSWVRVSAPGCNVAPLTHGGYGMFCGTSAATPMVAGLAALAVSLAPHATNAAVMQAIETSARRLGATVGHGRINAAAALAAIHS